MMNESGRYELTAALISETAFKQYLRHCDESYGTLAMKVTLLGAKVKPNPIKCSKAMIGHLATGECKGTSPARAKLIERALNAPTGSLFTYNVSRVAAGDSQLGREVA